MFFSETDSETEKILEEEEEIFEIPAKKVTIDLILKKKFQSI